MKFYLWSSYKKVQKKLVFLKFSKASSLKSCMSRAELSFFAKSSILKRAEPRLGGIFGEPSQAEFFD